MKIWYCKPGEPAVQGTTSATELFAMVLIRIPDEFGDPGETEIVVPREHVFLEPPVPTDPIDIAWHEAFTTKGYRYGYSEEMNAKAWFTAGWKARGKM